MFLKNKHFHIFAGSGDVSKIPKHKLTLDNMTSRKYNVVSIFIIFEKLH